MLARGKVEEFTLPCAKVEMWRRAVREISVFCRFHSTLADSLEGFHSRLRQLNAQKRASRFRGVLKDMELAGVAPDAPIYRTLIMGGMQAKRLQDVMYYYDRMRTSGIPVDVVLYNAVISTCARVGEMHAALQVMRDLVDTGVKPNERTYVSLLNVCAAVGNSTKAEELLGDMEEVGLKPNAFAYSAVIAALRGRKSKSRSALEKIDGIMERAANAGLLDSDATITEENGKVWDQRTILYNALLGAYVQMGEFGRAEETWSKMVEEGLEPAPLTVSHMLTMHLKRSNLDKATEVFSRFRSTGKMLPLMSYMQILRLAVQKDADQALDIADAIIEDLREKGYFLSPDDGSFVLWRVSEKEGGRGIELANKVWEYMMEHEKRPRNNSALAYLQALELHQPDNYVRISEVKRMYSSALQPPHPTVAEPTDAPVHAPIVESTIGDDLPRTLEDEHRDDPEPLGSDPSEASSTPH